MQVLSGVQALLVIFAFGWPMQGYSKSADAPKAHAYADINGGLKFILQMFKSDCGRYPTAAEGLKILIAAPTDGSLTNWRGPYFDPPKVPKDPWGHEYVYRFPAIYSTNDYDLYSMGPDGISKSGGNDTDDICNWEKPFVVSVTIPVSRKILWPHLILIVPILFGARVVAGLCSKRVRRLMMKSPGRQIIWLVMSVAAVFVWLSVVVPQLIGR